MAKTPTRSEIKEQDTWNLKDLYPSDEAWEEELDGLKNSIKKIEGYVGTLGRSASDLLSYLKYQDELSLIIDKFANYSMRKADEDTSNPTYQAMSDKTISILTLLGSAMAFAGPEIISIDDATMDKFFNDEPELNVYKRYITETRKHAAHTLSNAEEQLMALSGDMASAPEAIYSLLADADTLFPDAVDSKGESHSLSQSTFVPLLHSKDVTLREDAFNKFYAKLSETKNTYGALLSAQVKQLMFNARARKYNNTLEAALDETDVDPAVYKNLITAVHKNMDAMYDYVDLRKKALGVDELHMYDLYVPITETAEMKVSFEEAKKEVLEALSVMGEDYTALLKEGFDNRWIDVYENVGKRSGAYSCGTKVHPFVLLNFGNDLNSEFTLAHEMGHALHSYYSNTNQPTVDSEYKIFVAEVASICNESLLMQHLLKKATDKKTRAYLINYFLEQFRTTLYRQCMFAEFELKMNELAESGEAVNAQSLTAIYHDLIDLYFGHNIVHDEYIDAEWMRIPHFYYNFYVYQYSTGFSAAIALSQKILKEGPSAVEAYKGFLKGGCSKDPVSLLKGAGVDMSTTKPIEEALDMFRDLLKEMDAILA